MKNKLLTGVIISTLTGFAQASPISFKIKSSYSESGPKEKEHHDWRNSLMVEPGQTYVVNYMKKTICDESECTDREYLTEITPELTANQQLKVGVRFLSKSKENKREFVGDLLTVQGETTSIKLKSQSAPGQEFFLRVSTEPERNKML